MGKINRVIWIVLDSAGIGAAKDADKFDDEGTNTIGHVSEKNNGLNINSSISCYSFYLGC